jgi:hypothetical protein
MDFIFMLTRQDRTVLDGIEVLDALQPAGLEHVGFKDIGVDLDTLRQLNRRIKDRGATSYLEVVSATPEAVLNSARIAATIGVDRLLGGTDVDGILQELAGTKIEYYPFPGRPVGHPTKLGGTPAEVEAQCAAFLQRGCAGVDLLAYRATESDPLELVRAARRGMQGKGRLICAGSVDSPARIQALAAAGCDAFTIGSAAFDSSFSPRKGLLLHQIMDILAACRGTEAGQPLAQSA